MKPLKLAFNSLFLLLTGEAVKMLFDIKKLAKLFTPMNNLANRILLISLYGKIVSYLPLESEYLFLKK